MNDERKQLLAELRTIRSRADEIGRRLAELDEEDEAERNARTRRRAFYAVPAIAVMAGIGFVASQTRKYPGTAATGAVALAAVSAFLVAAQGDPTPPLADQTPPGIHTTAPPETTLAPPPSTTPVMLAPTTLTSEQAAPTPTPGNPPAVLRPSQHRPALVSVHTPPTTTRPGTPQSDPPPVSQQPDPPPTGPIGSTPPPGTRRCSPLLGIHVPVLDLRLCAPGR